MLGDFVHAARLDDARPHRLACRLARARSQLACAVVLGNHDARAGGWLATLGFEVAEEPAPYAGCDCRHFPLEDEEALADGPATLAGHVHPMTRLYGPGRDSLRLPCFVVAGRQVVLPAFGEFTGGSYVPRRPQARLMAATEIGVFEAGVEPPFSRSGEGPGMRVFPHPGRTLTPGPSPGRERGILTRGAWRLRVDQRSSHTRIFANA